MFGKSIKRNVEPSELSFNHMIAWVALSRLGPSIVEELDAAELGVVLDVDLGGYASPVRYKISPGCRLELSIERTPSRPFW
jgi:hypothetical protein